jgi:hypothetical protein
MRSTPTAAAAALAALAVVTPSPAAQELDTQIATLTRATPVAAYGHTAAWSERDPRTGQYRLVVLRGRRWSAIAVTPRTIPFDVDVGPGPDGVAVTYSRCAFEAPERFVRGLSVLPDYTRSRECRMYRYDVRAGRERALGGHRQGVLPTVWRSRVAYVTPGTRRLREAAALGGGRVRARGKGPRGTHATSLDLGSGRRLAAVWHGESGSRLRLGDRLVARVGAPARVLGMGFDAGVLFFRTTCGGSPAGCPESYWAYRPRSRARYAAAESADVVAAAHGGGATYALHGHDRDRAIGCSDETPCSLIIEDQLEFSRIEPR